MRDAYRGLRDAALWIMYEKGPVVRTLAKAFADKDPRVLQRLRMERAASPSALARDLLSRRASLVARSKLLRRYGVKRDFKRSHGTDMKTFFQKK